jgi:hypothetical protein
MLTSLLATSFVTFSSFQGQGQPEKMQDRRVKRSVLSHPQKKSVFSFGSQRKCDGEVKDANDRAVG